MARSARRRRVFAALAAAVLSVPALAVRPTLASAAPPGRWAEARMTPSARAEALALERADAQLLAGRRLRRIAAEIDPLRAGGLLVHQQQARRILEAAGGARAQSPELRLRLGEVLGDLGAHRQAAAVLETVVHVAPVHLRVDAWVELAVAYARLGRTREEIACYDRALVLEPHAPTRATMLANQAEATMTTGDVDRAVAGYRAALATIESLSAQEVQVYAPTTLWGLAVALDRAGQTDAALDAVWRARSYDPLDSRLAGDGWFYNPPHDEAWYAGLGHLAVARRGPEPDVRLLAYARAIERFREYVDRAPEGDPWAPAARARVAALLAEQARAEKRLRPPLPAARRLSPSP